MKELFEQILKYLPLYVREFTGLLKGPKSFLRRRFEEGGDNMYRNSLIFAAISFCLIFLLKWGGGAEDATFKVLFIKSIVLDLIGFLVTAIFVVLAWRIVGSGGRTRSVLTVLAYVLGVLILVQGTFFLAAMGTMRMLDPKQHALMQKMEQARDIDDVKVLMEETKKTMQDVNPMRKAAAKASQAVAIVGDLIALSWLILVWGAFRELFGTTKSRSIVAFLIFLLFDTFNPYEFVRFFVQNAVT
jgi:membrane protein insertase Oxa1/YidC/SpoIIIJ